jgi:hypothetical protein
MLVTMGIPINTIRQKPDFPLNYLPMNIVIKDPQSNNEVHLTAEPEDYNGEQGLRIIFPEKDSFVMVYRGESWEVVDEEFVNPDLVAVIGKAIHPRAQYSSNSNAK